MAKAAFGMKLKAWKGAMFDRPHVRRALEWTRYYYLRHMGGYIRKVARSRMTHAAGPSTAPESPHRHGDLLYEQIFYGYDPASRSLVVGPALIDRLQEYPGVTIPELLERGGTVLKEDRKSGRRRTIHFEERPYMRVALEAALAPTVQARAWREARTKAAARH